MDVPRIPVLVTKYYWEISQFVFGISIFQRKITSKVEIQTSVFLSHISVKWILTMAELRTSSSPDKCSADMRDIFEKYFKCIGSFDLKRLCTKMKKNPECNSTNTRIVSFPLKTLLKIPKKGSLVHLCSGPDNPLDKFWQSVNLQGISQNIT